MPIYEYRCADCDDMFEVLLKAGESPTGCPRCRGKHLNRQLSRFAAARAAGSESQTGSATNGAMGGCCGGACGCG
jgi:putative FmdB family regulatory protein